MISSKFDELKALEVILYVSSKVEWMYHVGKIIYFANRYHLEDYGRFVVNDEIIAMKNGPVLSSIYDMIKLARSGKNSYKQFKNQDEILHSLLYIKGNSPIELDRLIPKRPANLEYLSQSDITALDCAIEKIKDLSFTELEAFSHDDLYHTARLNDEISIEDVIRYSKNPKELSEYLAG